MTGAARVASTRSALRVALGMKALLYGSAAGVMTLVLTAALDLLVGRPLGFRGALSIAPWLVAFATAIAVAESGGMRASLESVALWIESRVPLEYALVTAVEAPSPVPMLEAAIAGAEWAPFVWREGGRSLARGAAVLALSVAAMAALPAGSVFRVSSPRAGDSLSPNGVLTKTPTDHLSPLVVSVIPPAYSGEPAETFDDPSGIAALTGASIVVRGRGGDARISAQTGDTALPVLARGDTWSVRLTMPAKPTMLRVYESANARQRMIVLEARTDSAPTVTLTIPSRDTIVRVPRGSLSLAADVSDDIGIASATFEYIVSSGEGETFTFRSGRIGAVTITDRARRLALRARLSLDSLKLAAGDVVHVRAVAQDGNDVTGPGKGVSETRTIRVARIGEYDSVAVEAAAPPEADKSLISQRMLIVMTEALEKRRPTLSRASVIDESQRIGIDQKRLRKQVGSIVFSRLGGQPTEEEGNDEVLGKLTPEQLLKAAEAANAGSAGKALDFEGDETPVVAINRPLLEAYNAMWDASRALDAGEPGEALPPMRIALAAIQRARQAERIYLRGRPPAVVVDVARARMQGKDRGASSARPSRDALNDPVVRRSERFTRAVALLSTKPMVAIDSMLILRLDALADDPALSTAMGTAIDDLRSGRDATKALVRARRAAMGEARAVRRGLPLWSGW